MLYYSRVKVDIKIIGGGGSKNLLLGNYQISIIQNRFPLYN